MLQTDKQVCVLEDDPLMLEHLAGMVRELGFEPLPAGTVDEALSLVRRHSPWAAVIDILMPDKDGLNFIMELGPDRPERVVAISGGGRLGAGAVLQMAKGLGADATVVKPVRLEDLRQALEP
ncbi:response regulator [Brevundimonas sp.]|jgi:ActR/RegA family two-component response regulator|uniref:response regulator n=1 Tax=Brevundimonas sp. TaxID=1871086 RepID=UPI002E0EC029|nr:response regulator [Brevundimonas sp.]